MRLRLLILIASTCSCMMRGQVWTSLIDSVPNSQFHILSTVVDSNSNTLYLGGYFERVNQFPFHTARSIIRYNGITFDTLQTGIDYQDSTSLPTIHSMRMFQNKLYVFGNFKKTGKYHSKYIGRWNGSGWDSLEFKPKGIILQTDVYNNELYMAGGFDTVGGVAITGVAKYDGTNWFNLGHPVPGGAGVSAIKNYNGKLYMAGMVTPASTNANLSYYDGTKWVPWVGVSGDGNKAIFGMNVIDSMLYVYGRFNSIAGTNCRGLAAYNSKTNTWYGFGSGVSNSSNQTIYNVQKVNGMIYVTGVFHTIEDVNTAAQYPPPPSMGTNLIKLDGNKWCAPGPPFDNVVAGVIGFKNNVYAYGSFRQIGKDTVYGFVRWDGANSVSVCSSPFSITTVYAGLGETISFGNIRIFPNPVKEKLSIEFSDFDDANVKLELRNSLGQLVYASEDVMTKHEIDLSFLSKGIYYLSLSSHKSRQWVYKVVKQ